MNQGGTVTVDLELNDREFNAALGRADSKAAQFTDKMDARAKKLGDFGKKMTAAVTLPIVGGFTLAAKSAIDFESRLADVSTLITGDSTQAVGELKDGILELTKTVPKSADDLGAGAYSIVSAGISDTSEALKVLKDSGRLATAGLSTTAEATDVMTSALNAFGYDASQSADVADILFKTVKAGKTDVSQIAQAFGATAPIIAAAGISLEEFSAATAALTTTGQPASQAQNSLRQAVVSLQKPTADMAKLFKLAGIESGEQALKQDGLQKTMLKLNKAAGGNAEVLARAYGSVEALGAATGLTDTVSGAFTNTLGTMTEGSEALGEAFDKNAGTTGAQMEKLKNTFTALGIQIGDKLLPFVTAVGEKLGDLANKFGGLSDGAQNAILVTAGIAAALGPVALAFSALIKVGKTTMASLKTAASAAGKAWQGVKFVASWAGKFAKIVAKGAAAAAKLAAQAVKIGAKWAAQAIVAAAGWLAQFALMIARAVFTAAVFVAQALIAAAAWVASAIAVAAAWLIAMAPVLLVIAAIGLAVFLVIKYWEPIKEFFASVWQKVTDIFASVIDWVKKNWPLLLAIITGPIGLAILAVVKNFDKIKEVAGKVVDKIKGFFGSAGTFIKESFSKTVGFITGIPGKIIGALGNMASLLYNSGKDLIQGLLDGAGSLLTKIGTFFLDKVPGFIKAPFKKALGIASPSKVFGDYGKNIVDGLAIGVDSNASKAIAAAANLGNSVAGTAAGVDGGGFNVGAEGAGSGGGVTQINNVYTEYDMDRVSRDLAWQLTR